MLAIGIVVVVLGVIGIVLGARTANEQSRRAGADPAAGDDPAYAWEGGVSRATSAVVLGSWALVVIGIVLAVIGLVG